MEVKIQYTGQLANHAGLSEEVIEIPDSSTCRQLIDEVVKRHGAEFSDLILNSDGEIRPSTLIILDGEQAQGAPEALLLDGVDTVMLMTPIAGG